MQQDLECAVNLCKFYLGIAIPHQTKVVLKGCVSWPLGCNNPGVSSRNLLERLYTKLHSSGNKEHDDWYSTRLITVYLQFEFMCNQCQSKHLIHPESILSNCLYNNWNLRFFSYSTIIRYVQPGWSSLW